MNPIEFTLWCIALAVLVIYQGRKLYVEQYKENHGGLTPKQCRELRNGWRSAMNKEIHLN